MALLNPPATPDLAIPAEHASQPTLPRVRRLSARRWLELLALAGVATISASLNLIGLNGEGFGNTYYAAAVWSMLQNWRAFLFASFDAGGFVSVDKPPVGLWVQVLSARLLGFTGVALLLPQALAGVGSVLVLYALVRRSSGAVAATVAAAVLAVTPISVVTDRNNTMDATLVFVLLLAVWAVSIAAERGSLRTLLLGAALVGVGFNIKMLQAYPIVPGLALAYLLCAPVRRRLRLVHLVLGAVVLVGVSLSWSVFVDLVPAALRPYVGSSGTNSALSLALGYNGLSRITLAIAERIPALNLLGSELDLQVAPLMSPGIGNAGWFRLFDPLLAGQASWLLPFALVGLLMAGWRGLSGHLLPASPFLRPFLRLHRRLPPPPPARPFSAKRNREASHGASREDEKASRGRHADITICNLVAIDPRVRGVRRQRIATLTWGGWLIVWGAIFSFARFYHVYYLIMLGPAVAALAGMGAVALWRMYRHPRGGWTRLLLPATLLVTAWVQWRVVAATPSVHTWLAPTLVAGAALASAILLLPYLLQLRPGRAARAALGLGLAWLLIAPLTWSVISVQNGYGGGWLVEAGPSVAGGFGGGFGRGGPGGPPGPAGFTGGVAGGGGPGAFGAPFGGPGGGGANSAMTFAGPNWDRLDPGLVQYLEDHQGSADYLVATQTSSYASLFILASRQPAMALGGYQGWDRILTPAELEQLIADGAVRFFYLSTVQNTRGFGAANANLDATADLTAWVVNACTVVPPSTWQSSPTTSPTAGGLQLYDCAPAVQRSQSQ